jgi:carbon storage regulator
MLVLSRKLNEAIIVDGNIRITVVGIRGSHIRLGIEAPDRVPILREELCVNVSPGEVRPGSVVRPGEGFSPRRTPVPSRCRPCSRYPRGKPGTEHPTPTAPGRPSNEKESPP